MTRIRILYFTTLMLTMLGLIMGGAHVLELVPKMHYDTRLYQEVTSTLYKYYGIVGGSIHVLAILTAATLTYSVRGSRGFRWAGAGLLCLILSLVLWFVLIQPVNAEWGRVLQTGPPESVLESYARLRNRWEWGHVAAFLAWFTGAGLLVLSLLSQLPSGQDIQ